MNNIIECLEARKRTIETHMQNRRNKTRDFSDWGLYELDNLEGRLEEINNTLTMLYRHLGIKKDVY